MVTSGGVRRLPHGWEVLSNSDSDEADDRAAAGARDAAAARRPAPAAPLGGTLPTVWPEAILAAILFCTPLHPLGYAGAIVALARARRIGRADGWPLVPGLAVLLCALLAAAACDVLALWRLLHPG